MINILYSPLYYISPHRSNPYTVSHPRDIPHIRIPTPTRCQIPTSDASPPCIPYLQVLITVGPPSVSSVVDIPSFLPKKQSTSAITSSRLRPLDIEISDSDTKSEKSDRTPLKKVHFCPECDSPLPDKLSLFLGLEGMQSRDERDEKEVADRELLEQQMRDTVYKQMEMWGEALGKTGGWMLLISLSV